MERVTLIPGDGIGPEVTAAAQTAIEATGAQIYWDTQYAGETAFQKSATPLPPATVDSFNITGVCFKGPLTTPIGYGFQSVNVQLRRTFDLYANVRPVKTFEGVKSRYTDVDLVIVRENTEGEYTGIEHYVDQLQTIAEAISVTSKAGCRRVIEYAFREAERRRRKLTLVHKANILKLTSGMFLKTGHERCPDFSVEFNDLIVDNCAMQLVLNPSRFDVIVTTNLFGDILSDLTAGLVGGLGLVGSANVGTHHVMFEAVHGTAPDIAGKGIANPTAMMMSGVMMLHSLGYDKEAIRMDQAIRTVIAKGKHTTGDIGGPGNTATFTEAVIEEIKHGPQ